MEVELGDLLPTKDGKVSRPRGEQVPLSRTITAGFALVYPYNTNWGVFQHLLLYGNARYACLFLDCKRWKETVLWFSRFAPVCCSLSDAWVGGIVVSLAGARRQRVASRAADRDFTPPAKFAHIYP
ncbi:hypothetical protein ACJJTC_009713 [Scirpophaga incertulas]